MTDHAPPPPFTSDELGDVGEAELQRLAAMGPMTVNKAGRDRAGWDFLVQAPAESSDTFLDKRTVLWNNYVQVKAGWKSKRPRVRLTLSAAEKLAKHRDATFIAAFLYDRTNVNEFDIYIVELTGDRLAAILKALREHQKEGTRALNEAQIYLNLNSDERLAVASGPALRERLAQAHRNAEPDGYPALKTRELATIGFTEGRLRGTITLYDIDRKSLFDVLLGKQSWDAGLSEFVETRFEVDLPLRDAPIGRGVVKFTPKPQATCELVVRSKGLRGQLTFSGDHHQLTLPGPKGLETRARFCFLGFTIETGDGHIRLKSTDAESEHTSLNLTDWRRYWRLLAACRDHPTNYVLRSPLLNKSLEWTYRPFSEDIPHGVKHTLLAIEAAYDLAEELNIPFEPISMENLSKNAKKIVMARHFGCPGSPKVTLKIPATQSTGANYSRNPIRGVHVDYFDMNTHRIATSSLITMRFIGETNDETGEDIWESTNPRRLLVQRIGISQSDFAAFVDESKSISKRDHVFLGDIDSNFIRDAIGDTTTF